jgi:hypothetical protein
MTRTNFRDFVQLWDQRHYSNLVLNFGKLAYLTPAQNVPTCQVQSIRTTHIGAVH